MIGTLLTALGNLIIFVVVAILVIVGVFLFLLRRALTRGGGQGSRRAGYGAPRPGVRVVDSTVVDEAGAGAGAGAGASSTPRAAGIPDSAEVQIIEVTTRED